MPKLSIIIPTFNRVETLKICINHIKKSSIDPKTYEIIVVNDGSTDGTKKFLETQKNIIALNQENQGQAVARNKAIKKAKGEIILFIGDDIFIDKNLLKEHIESHKKHPQKNYAVLGFIDWDPKIKISPLMRWLTNDHKPNFLKKFEGPQFAFHRLKNNKFADYRFFYTSNISLKKSLLETNPFDLKLNGYGFEDIELGFRLTKNEDLKLIYNKKAKAFHHHEIKLQDLKNRMISIGKSAIKFQKIHPELKVVPNTKKKLAFHLISNPLSLLILNLISTLTFNLLKPIYYYALSKRYFLIGLKKQNLAK